VLVRHSGCGVVGPHGSVQLGGIDFRALRPFHEIHRPVGRIGTPPLKQAGVDRLVDVDVAAVVPFIGLPADGAVERRKHLGVIPR
jgi:hypothetical protein